MKKVNKITGKTKLILGGLATAIVGVTTVSAKMAMTFESGMAQVWTLTNVSKKRLDSLSMSVLNLSRNLGAPTRALTKGLYDIVSAGVAVKNSMGFLRVATTAAVAGATNTAVAVDALTSIVNAYGDALGKNLSVVERAKKANDILFLTVKYGKTTFEELAQSVGTLTAVGAQVGVSFRQIGAALATLTKGGIKSQVAIVYLRQILMSVIKPSSEASKLAEKLGIDFSVASLKARGLAGFLNYVKEATDNNSKSLATLFPNVRALSAVMALTGKQANEYNTILAKMQVEHGAANEAFKKMEKTASVTWKKVIAGAKATAIAFGTGLLKGIKDVSLASQQLQKHTIDLNLVMKTGKMIVKGLASAWFLFKAGVLAVTAVIAKFWNYLKIAVKKTLLFLVKAAKLVRINLKSLERYARGINTTSYAHDLLTQSLNENRKAYALWNKESSKTKNEKTQEFDVLAYVKSQRKKQGVNKEATKKEIQEVKKRIEKARELRVKQREQEFQRIREEKRFAFDLTNWIEEQLNKRVNLYQKSITKQKNLLKSLYSEYKNLLFQQRRNTESFMSMRVSILSKGLSKEGKAVQARGLATFYKQRAEEARTRGNFERERSLLKQAQQIYYQLAMSAKQPTWTQDYIEFLKTQNKIQATFEKQKAENVRKRGEAEKKIKELKKKVEDFFTYAEKQVKINLNVEEAKNKLDMLANKLREKKESLISAGILKNKGKEKETSKVTPPPTINITFNVKEKVDKKTVRNVIIPEIQKATKNKIVASGA